MGLNTTNVTPRRGALTNRSGSITTGATAQAVCAANANRKFLLFQNISAEAMYVNFDGTTAVADQPSILVSTLTTLRFDEFVPTGSISVIAATTGSKFVCKEA